MEKKEDNEIIPKNDDAPPTILSSMQHNNNQNIEYNKGINQIIDKNNNNNMKSQISPILQKNRNKKIESQNNIINNSINNNEELINNNQNFYNFSIDMNIDMLNNLNKNDLIDIIIFIQYACKIKILSKYVRLSHDIFRLIHRGKIKEYFLVKKNWITHQYYQNGKKNNNNINFINNENDINSDSESDSNENGEKNEIIKEQNFININTNKYIPELFFCELHNKVYLNKNYEKHFNSHKKCPICGAVFPSNRKLKFHNKEMHFVNNNINEIINNKNKDIYNQNLIKDENKIKCTDCEKYFDTLELMSAHYYEEHEKEKKSQEELKKIKLEKEQNELAEKKRQEILKKINYYYEYFRNNKINNKAKKDNNLDKNDKNKAQFFCKICKRSFNSKFSLNQHCRAKGHFK